MVLGSFAAIGQHNIKRLMAYSSIGHVGFALVGLAANSQEGVRGVAIYMLIYLVMTLGTFAFILAMRRKEGNVEEIGDLAGLSNTNPVMATILTILMFSLAGIPPLAGFWAKWYVFLAAINAGLYALAVIGVLASVVGAYYYLRIIKIMWFDEPVGGFLPMSGSLRFVLGLSGAFILFYVLPWIGGSVSSYAEAAAKTFFWRWVFRSLRRQSRKVTGSKRMTAVGSTNAIALEHATAGDPGKLWVVSKRQESGRGRRGRAWATPEGNLAATLLLVEAYDLKLAATLGFVAGLALADALDAVVPERRIAIAVGRRRTGRPRRPLRTQMAERRARRRRQARRHPARIVAASGQPRGAGDRHRRQCRRASRRRSLSGDLAEGARISRRCRDAVPGALRCVERKHPHLEQRRRADAKSASAGCRAPPG